MVFDHPHGTEMRRPIMPGGRTRRSQSAMRAAAYAARPRRRSGWSRPHAAAAFPVGTPSATARSERGPSSHRRLGTPGVAIGRKPRGDSKYRHASDAAGPSGKLPIGAPVPRPPGLASRARMARVRASQGICIAARCLGTPGVAIGRMTRGDSRICNAQAFAMLLGTSDPAGCLPLARPCRARRDSHPARARHGSWHALALAMLLGTSGPPGWPLAGCPAGIAGCACPARGWHGSRRALALAMLPGTLEPRGGHWPDAPRGLQDMHAWHGSWHMPGHLQCRSAPWTPRGGDCRICKLGRRPGRPGCSPLARPCRACRYPPPARAWHGSWHARHLLCRPVPWNPRGGHWPDAPRGYQDMHARHAGWHGSWQAQALAVLLGTLDPPGWPLAGCPGGDCRVCVPGTRRGMGPGMSRRLRCCSVPW
jgi:hypothetical protein